MNREIYEKVYFQENYARQFGAFRDQSASRATSAHVAEKTSMPNATTVVMMEDTHDGGVTITTGDFVAYFNRKYGHDRITAVRRSIAQAQRHTELKRARANQEKAVASKKKARPAPQKRTASRHSVRPGLSFVRAVFGMMLILSLVMVLGTSFLMETTRDQVMALENEVAALENTVAVQDAGDHMKEDMAEYSYSANDSVEVYTPVEQEKVSPVAALLNALATLGK